MLVRDSLGIILQFPIDKNSGGDSARSCGMMALFGSKLDQKVLGSFELKKGHLTRHPTYYDDGCFTRDQLLVLTAGFWAAKETALARRVFWAHAKRLFFCQNHLEQFTRREKGWFGRDPLSPSHIGHLILCAKLWWLYPFLIISIPWLMLDILWSTKVKPYSEQNQIIAMSKVAGLTWMWRNLHPHWEQSIKAYWCGWRAQQEIAEQIIQGIED